MSKREEWTPPPKPDDAQCTHCSVDEPYPETVMASGVFCGGCGRRRPAITYSRPIVTEEMVKQGARALWEAGELVLGWETVVAQWPSIHAQYHGLARAMLGAALGIEGEHESR